MKTVNNTLIVLLTLLCVFCVAPCVLFMGATIVDGVVRAFN